MAIAVRSVKAGMTSFGHLRSRLKNGAKPGCKAAAIEPPCSDAYASSLIKPQMLTGVRNPSPINHKTSRTNPFAKQPSSPPKTTSPNPWYTPSPPVRPRF
ncbi:hypothetical protein EYY86_01785 [Hafnia paralvei]|nr:hypothetical protein EYY86_01785 [Hafnia paralvei]